MGRGKLNATNCYFSGIVGDTDYSIGGGILGIGDANLTNCFFDGILTRGTHPYGGVGGLVWSHTNGTIKNCYSIITATNSDKNAGIVYRTTNARTIVDNCYSIAKTNGCSVVSYEGVPSNIKNCFYLLGSYQYTAAKNTTTTGVTQKSEDYMKSDEFVEELNNGADIWTRDDNINDGYPILKSINYRK